MDIAFLGEPYTRQLDGKLRELRFHLDGRPVRATYWIASGRRIVLLTVFAKTRMREVAETCRPVRRCTRSAARRATAAYPVRAGVGRRDDPVGHRGGSHSPWPPTAPSRIGTSCSATSPRSTWVAARQLFGRRDDDLLPALIWLAAAVVEQYGDGDVSWLPHGHHVP